MMTYQKTHPWMKFSADLAAAPATLWILLGEAASKCEHLGGVPLKPAVAQQLLRIYLAKGALASTAIEGNTLSEEQVIQHLDGKLTLPPSQEYLKQEVDNIISACNWIGHTRLAGQHEPITPDRIREFNRRVLENLECEPHVIPGQFCQTQVGVGRYRGAPPDEIPSLVEKLCNWINGPDFDPQKPELAIPYALIRAILTHLYIAWIHPFGDGNGRTARLLEFDILIAAGVPFPAAHLLSNHYNNTRADYYRQLDRASRSGGDIIPFIEYAIRGVVDELKTQIDRIREHQMSVAWTNFVHESFRGKKGDSNTRKRNLVLALSEHREPVPFSELNRLDPTVAAAYAKLTTRALARDIAMLVRTSLVQRKPNGYVANTQQIRAFLAPRAKPGKNATRGQ